MIDQPHHLAHDAQTFREVAAEAVDWVADYLDTVGNRPVAAQVAPGEIRNRISASAPAHGEPVGRILASLTEDLLPGVTHWNHPRFFAYVPQSATPPSIVADMIVSALNVNGLLWQTSPALTELEDAVLGWLAELLRLPPAWFGQIQESASLGTLTALTVARARCRARGGEHGGVICSREAHASVHKAAHLLDLPLTIVDADADGRISLPELERALDGSGAAAVVATVGTTSNAAVDPLVPIAALCERHGAWLHVDGAYASAAAICSEHAHILDGIAAADSFVINAHKWLGTTAACTCLYTAHRDELRAAFATAPDYLDKDDDLVNLVDYGPMFSRRLAALKLWFTMRAAGAEGMRDAIRASIGLARELAQLVEDDPAWELCSHSFGVLCFRMRASDEANLRLLRAVNQDGRIFISRTRVGDRAVLRFAIGNAMTRRADILVAWETLRELAQQVIAPDDLELAAAP